MEKDTLQRQDLKAIRQEIADRLRPACAHMSDDEFETLVVRMALIEWKHLDDATPTPSSRLHAS